ncbi:MAG: hypothetical protein GY810_24775 [Aureispira sp.]|nr:hypothetical protein [Aureispira sp.]
MSWKMSRYKDNISASLFSKEHRSCWVASTILLLMQGLVYLMYKEQELGLLYKMSFDHLGFFFLSVMFWIFSIMIAIVLIDFFKDDQPFLNILLALVWASSQLKLLGPLLSIGAILFAIVYSVQTLTNQEREDD